MPDDDEPMKQVLAELRDMRDAMVTKDAIATIRDAMDTGFNHVHADVGAIRDELKAFRTANGIRFDALDARFDDIRAAFQGVHDEMDAKHGSVMDAIGKVSGEVAKLGEMITEQHVDKIGDDELAEADKLDHGQRLDALEKRVGIARP